MIFIVTKEHDVDNNEEIKVSEFKNKGLAADFVADFELRNENDGEAEVLGAFEGKKLTYSVQRSVAVDWT